MIEDIKQLALGSNSLVLAVVYTLGHILIAIVCVMVITGATWELATIDAIVEPLINGVWSTYYITHGRDIMTPREQAQLQAETAMTGFIAYSKRTVYVIIAVLFQ